MKKYTIRKAKRIGIVTRDNDWFKGIDCVGDDTMQVSDGYHTMDELYQHRINLFISLCAVLRLHTDMEVWKSKAHSDGSIFDGWFSLGIGTKEGKQITYHIPMSRWDDANFAVTLEKAPEWDGHTAEDVLERLKNI